jgi:peptidyl-dipeptidase A
MARGSGDARSVTGVRGVDGQAVLDEAVAVLAPLEQRAFAAEWALATEATPEHESQAEAAQVELELALSDPELHAAALEAEGDGTPLVQRAATRLRLAAAGRQRPRELTERIVALEVELRSLYGSHRCTVGGRELTDNEVDEILRTSTDVALRRETWEATRTIGERTGPLLRNLAHLRNEAARAQGYRDHYAMALAHDELDEGWLFDLLDGLDGALDTAWTREKDAIDADVRAYLRLPSDEPLMPWHYQDRFFQEPPSPTVDPLHDAVARVDVLDAARRYFGDLGHDVDAVLARSDLHPRPGKDQHAFQLTLDRGDDVRVLMNVAPTVRWLETVLHELGHAVYDLGIDRDLNWLLREPTHIFMTEAIAMLHGRQARDRAFLERYAGIAADVAGHPVNEVVARRHLHVLVPWVQVMARFERRLYADPDADHSASWWELVERYQRLRRPPGERPDEWAAKLHLAVAPVYYHNYLLGEICASQLMDWLGRETAVDSPAEAPGQAGRLLADAVFRPGASLRWDDLVRQATGEPLSTRAFVGTLA